MNSPECPVKRAVDPLRQYKLLSHTQSMKTLFENHELLIYDLDFFVHWGGIFTQKLLGNFMSHYKELESN